MVAEPAKLLIPSKLQNGLPIAFLRGVPDRGQTHNKMKNFFANLYRDEQGQDLIEYALVVALIAFASVTGMKTVATKINTAF